MDKLSDEVEIVLLADHLIAAAKRLGLDHAVRILKMARLDIVANLNGITTQELEAFASALSDRVEGHAAARRPVRARYWKARSPMNARQARARRGASADPS
jgi:hypothetical protein